jgi:hypothetical protein
MSEIHALVARQARGKLTPLSYETISAKGSNK